MGQARDKAAKRWFTDPGERLDEALREVGADMLDEPVPERLRRALQGKQDEAKVKAKGRSNSP